MAAPRSADNDVFGVGERDDGGLVNRISSVLTLPAKVLPAPADAISGVLAGLLEVLKIVGVGVALDLPGLEAMTPGSQFLQGLGQAANVTPEYFAAATDFEPGPVLANLFNGLDDEGRSLTLRSSITSTTTSPSRPKASGTRPISRTRTARPPLSRASRSTTPRAGWPSDLAASTGTATTLTIQR